MTITFGALQSVAAQQTTLAKPVDTSDIAGERACLGYLHFAAGAKAALLKGEWPEKGFLVGLADTKGTIDVVANGVMLPSGKPAKPGQTLAQDTELRLMAKLYDNGASMDDLTAVAVEVYVQAGIRKSSTKPSTKRLCRLGFVDASMEHGSILLRGRPQDEHQLPYAGYEISIFIEDNVNYLMLSGIKAA